MIVADHALPARLAPLCEWILHRNVYVPAASTTAVIDGPPGDDDAAVAVLERVPSLVGDSPGLMIHRSWTVPAVAAGKFQRTVSPTVARQRVRAPSDPANALTSTVFGVPPPPPAWSRIGGRQLHADRTVVGPARARRRRGERAGGHRRGGVATGGTDREVDLLGRLHVARHVGRAVLDRVRTVAGDRHRTAHRARVQREARGRCL